jgi:hypothetical protein
LHSIHDDFSVWRNRQSASQLGREVRSSRPLFYSHPDVFVMGQRKPCCTAAAKISRQMKRSCHAMAIILML